MKKNKLWNKFLMENVECLLDKKRVVLDEACLNFEKKLLYLALAKVNGDINRASLLLGINSSELINKIDKFGMRNN